VGLFGRHRSAQRGTVRSVRARRDPNRQLQDSIKRAVRHGADPERPPTAVQLLGQISGADDWPQIRDHWTRRVGLTGSWPQRLNPGERVLNLWPCAPGSVKLTTGVGLRVAKRQPRRLLSTPALLRFNPAERRITSEGALAQAILSWVDDVVVAHGEYPNGVQLAPPILEEWAPKGRLVSRQIHTFDVEWQLPAADGVIWPAP
jgi:hypothetical protein